MSLLASLDLVMVVAHRLPVTLIPEQIHVTPVGDNMVYNTSFLIATFNCTYWVDREKKLTSFSPLFSSVDLTSFPGPSLPLFLGVRSPARNPGISFVSP